MAAVAIEPQEYCYREISASWEHSCFAFVAITL